MSAFSSSREERGWPTTLLILTLLPLLISWSHEDAFQAALDRGDPTFTAFLILDALVMVLLLGMSLSLPLFRRLTGVCRSTAGIIVAVVAGGLWSVFGMFSYEISLLAAETILVRVLVWLWLVVWLGLLLRLAGEGRAWLKFGLVQLIFLVAAEIGISLVFPQGYSIATIWYNPGPLVPWREYVGWAGPIDSDALYFSPDEFTMLVQTNSHGHRDHEASYEKPAGTFRILAVGDSFTWSQEVRLEDTWHVRLESELSRPEQPVEVVAVGSGGWGTDQQLQYFIHDGCRYHPDLVLIQMTFNDVANNYMPFESADVGEIQKPYYELDDDNQLVLRNSPYAHPSIKSGLGYRIINSIRVTSRMALILTEAMRGSKAPSGFETVEAWQGYDPSTFLPFYIPEGEWPEHEEAYALTGAILAEFKAQAEACNARLAAFIIPYIHTPETRTTMPPWIREAFPDWANYSWNQLLPEERTTELAVQAGIPIMPYTDLLQFYDAYYEEHGDLNGVTWRWVGHFTPYGNQQVAAILARWLQEQSLVP